MIKNKYKFAFWCLVIIFLSVFLSLFFQEKSKYVSLFLFLNFFIFILILNYDMVKNSEEYKPVIIKTIYKGYSEFYTEKSKQGIILMNKFLIIIAIIAIIFLSLALLFNTLG